MLEVLAASAGRVQQLVDACAQLGVDRDDAPAAVDDQAQGLGHPCDVHRVAVALALDVGRQHGCRFVVVEVDPAVAVGVIPERPELRL